MLAASAAPGADVLSLADAPPRWHALVGWLARHGRRRASVVAVLAVLALVLVLATLPAHVQLGRDSVSAALAATALATTAADAAPNAGGKAAAPNAGGKAGAVALTAPPSELPAPTPTLAEHSHSVPTIAMPSAPSLAATHAVAAPTPGGSTWSGTPTRTAWLDDHAPTLTSVLTPKPSSVRAPTSPTSDAKATAVADSTPTADAPAPPASPGPGLSGSADAPAPPDSPGPSLSGPADDSVPPISPGPGLSGPADAPALPDSPGPDLSGPAANQQPWADRVRVAALQTAAAPTASLLRKAAVVAMLKDASACWTGSDGAWTLEPASFFNSPRGELSNRTCPLRKNAERLVEIGYRWIPPPARPACPPTYFRNADLAARLLAHVSCLPLLKVGDSLSSQYTDTLDDYTTSYAPPNAAVRRLNHTYVYNAHLALNVHLAYGGHGNRSRLEPWVPLLDSHSYAVILVNRGAHFIGTDIALPELQRSLLYIREHHPDALLLYRTAPAGHDNCNEMKNRPPLSATPVTRGFSWSRMRQQNADFRAMIEQSFPTVVTVDVENATVLRADSHVIELHRRQSTGPTAAATFDCTHYCIPGPLDMWVEVVGNLLLLAVELGLLPSCAARGRV